MPLSALIRRIRTKEVWCIVGSHWTSEPIAAKLSDFNCCIDCANEHNGPGQVEAYNNPDDPTDLGICLILIEWMMNSGEDDQMSSQGWGYCGRFDNYLLYQDDRGFFKFDEFKDAEEAQRYFDRLYADGWGAQEDDAYINNEGWGRWYVSFDGKQLQVHPRNDGSIDERRCLAAIRLEMIRTGYYPNVWIDTGHGLRLVKGL